MQAAADALAAQVGIDEQELQTRASARTRDRRGASQAAAAEGHESVAHHRGELGAIEGPGSPERTLPQRVNGRAVSGRIVGADVNARHAVTVTSTSSTSALSGSS